MTGPVPLKAAVLFLAALVLSLPFGAWRVRTVRFRPAWFLAVHLPILPLILLRLLLELPLPAIAAELAGTVAGQLLGGRLFRPESPSQGRSSR